MKQKIYLLIGVPGSGKTWVCDQLQDHYEIVRNDDFMRYAAQLPLYTKVITERAMSSNRPVLAEVPFGIDEILKQLRINTFRIEQVFIIETPEIVASRYFARESSHIPTGHLTRMNTYAERAKQILAVQGTSEQVLNYLKKKSHL